MAAGVIAEAVDVSPSNVSFHLRDLEHAGMVVPRREARSIIYSADFTGLRDLIAFLMKDCCAGHPEICASALADVTRRPSKARKKARA
jgi:ArsR family transcriptional regulator